MGRRSRKGPPERPEEVVDAILAYEDVVYLPVKHYSPAVALAVETWIRTHRPAAVLVEGPEDAQELLPYLVDPLSDPPLAILSTYVDSTNRFGQNGVLSLSEDVPARFRAWWPLVGHAPEYRALLAGHEVGADLHFVDASLRATIPFQHVPRGDASRVIDDRELAESRYFRELASRTGARNFDEFWQATFEGRGLRAPDAAAAEALRRALLTFAWCARNTASEASLEADGTLLRERHMRWHVDQVRKEHPEGVIAVVVGAFHAVALPWTKGKRATRADKKTETLLCAHSYRALSRLYHLERRPRWGEEAFRAAKVGEERPADAAAQQLLLEVLREARARGVVVATGDAIGAWTVARNLATVRGHPQVTVRDLEEAVLAGFVKGDAATFAAPVQEALDQVLVGARIGVVSERAGRPPIVDDFYRQAKGHRIDVSGQQKKVRCAIGRDPKHRERSAFLHRCVALDIPLFSPLEGRRGGFFRGPDLVAGTDLQLLGETWGVRWTEEIDDRLLELSGDGDSLEEACILKVRRSLADDEDGVRGATRALVQVAQMRLVDLLPDALSTVEARAARDARFDALAEGVSDLLLLVGYREALPTHGDPRVHRVLAALHRHACLHLHQLAGAPDEQLLVALEQVQTLVRAVLLAVPEGVDAADEGLLVVQLLELLARPDVPAGVEGAATGVLYSLGHLGERDIERQLHARVGGPRVQEVGAWLDGLFLTSRSLLLGSESLLLRVHDVVRGVDEATFRWILPDLRRAFTRFIPAEIQEIGGRVAQLVDDGDAVDEVAAPSEELRGQIMSVEASIEALIAGRMRELRG
jgi:hypothetical protein